MVGLSRVVEDRDAPRLTDFTQAFSEAGAYGIYASCALFA
jgi:hypothetical protein